MRKVVLQGAATILLFFSTWFVLKQVDWMTLLRFEKNKDNIEEALGKILWEVFKDGNKEDSASDITAAVDSLVSEICKGNNIQKSRIKVHILNNNEINAFALPDGHLVIYTGLISASEDQEELCGVICHEMAHITMGHVMEKLLKEAGLSVLISMTTNSGGAEMVKETAKVLSSSAYDRKLEKEADLKAVDLLIGTGLDPRPFANFMYRMKDIVKVPSYLSWLNNHPDSEDRVRYIVEYSSGNNICGKKILTDESWNKLKNGCKPTGINENTRDL